MLKVPFRRSDDTKAEFCFVDFISEGSYGDVCRGTVNGKQGFAIKTLVIKSKKDYQYAQLEHEIWKKINSDNVNLLIDARPYPNNEIIEFYGFLMEKAICDLSVLISKREIINGVNACKQIMTGVTACHDLNIIHKNLEPSNILCFENERYKITGFGKSILPKTEYSQRESKSDQAPELDQVGSQFTDKADVYSVSAVLVAILNNRDVKNVDMDKVISFIEKKELRSLLRDMRHSDPAQRPSSSTVHQRLIEAENCALPEEDRATFYCGWKMDKNNAYDLMRKMLNYLLCENCSKKKIPREPCKECKDLDKIKTLFDVCDQHGRLVDVPNVDSILKNMIKIMNHEYIADNEDEESYEFLRDAAEKFLEKNEKIGGSSINVWMEYLKVSKNNGFIFVYWEADDNRVPTRVRFIHVDLKMKFRSVRDRVVAPGSHTIEVHNSGLWGKEFSKITEYPQKQNERGVVPAEKVGNHDLPSRADIFTVAFNYKGCAIRKLFPYFKK